MLMSSLHSTVVLLKGNKINYFIKDLIGLHSTVVLLKGSDLGTLYLPSLRFTFYCSSIKS